MSCDCRSYNAQIGTVEERVLKVSDYYKKCTNKELTICVDNCIADQIIMLWENDIWTQGCCCGHNDMFGNPSVIIDTAEDPKIALELLDKYDPDRQWVVKQWSLRSYFNIINRDSKDDIGKENYYFNYELNKVMCAFTKNECIVNDTVNGSSCSVCKNNPSNKENETLIIVNKNVEVVE